MEDEIIQFEYDMWNAAFHKDVETFKKLVSSNAVMICGGDRCIGSEYAEFIRFFDISGYNISNMEVVSKSDNEVLLHYVIRVEVDKKEAEDLSGNFHVASLWKKCDESWILVFNMDSRIMNNNL
ncbi:MAG: DUF4440 domain-containing protein [Oscillospiraceae bacterium]